MSRIARTFSKCSHCGQMGYMGDGTACVKCQNPVSDKQARSSDIPKPYRNVTVRFTTGRRQCQVQYPSGAYGCRDSTECKTWADRLNDAYASGWVAATLPSRVAAMEEALKWIVEQIQQIPGGIDENADASNTTVEDAAHHIGGLVYQKAKSALEGGGCNGK